MNDLPKDSSKEEEQENALTSKSFNALYEAVGLLYIRDNISGRLKFTAAWPVAARHVLGETLIAYDRDGAPDLKHRQHRSRLEDEAEDRRFELLEVLETLEEKSVKKHALRLDLIETIIKQFGSELSRLFYAPKIVDRFNNYPAPLIEESPLDIEVEVEEVKIRRTKVSQAEAPPIHQPSVQETPTAAPHAADNPAKEVRTWKQDVRKEPSEPRPLEKTNPPAPENAQEKGLEVPSNALEMPQVQQFRMAVPKDSSKRKAVPKRKSGLQTVSIPVRQPVQPKPNEKTEDKPQPKNPQKTDEKLVRGLLPVHKKGQRKNLKRSEIRDLAKMLEKRKQNPPPQKTAVPPVIDTKVQKKTTIVPPAVQDKPQPEMVFVPATKKGPLPGKTAKPKKKPS